MYTFYIRNFSININVTITLHTYKQYKDDTMGEQKTMSTPMACKYFKNNLKEKESRRKKQR